MRTLIYGAYGYTGELVAREAHERGLDIVIAGRDGDRVASLANELGVSGRAFAAGNTAGALADVDAVLNCAGPFAATAKPIVEACIETETNYLDITGELDVFEALAERDREAERAGCFLLPGVGLEVVPTDCLAVHLHDRLPGAETLRLGVEAPLRLSGGTLASLLEHVDSPGVVCRDGRLAEIAPGSLRREVDLGAGPRSGVAVPLPDVTTAYYSTGIENIEVYTAMPEPAIWVLRASPVFGAVLGNPAIRRPLQRSLQRLVPGPSRAHREGSRAYVWGEANDGDETVTSRLSTPGPYAFTPDSATTALERLEGAEANPTGFQTPATAFGASFVTELDSVQGFLDEGFPDLLSVR